MENLKRDQGLKRLPKKSLHEKYWTAFYTKPQNEKKVAERLTDEGFEVYCPLVETVRIWSDRKKKVKVPLFKSYVFVRVDEKLRLEVLQDHGIIFNLHWLKKPSVIRNEEIEAIQEFLNEHNDVKAVAKSLDKGQKVTVKSGALQGQDGIVKEIRGSKVVLELQRLGYVLSAEVPGSHLAKKVD